MAIYKRKDSPSWWYSFRLPNGQRFRESSGTHDKKLAHQIFIAKRSEYQKVHYGFQHQRIKLASLIDDYLQLYSKHSKRNHRDDVGKFNKIRKFFGDILIHEVTTSKLEEYRVERLSEGVSKSTVNREMALLKHTFNKGIEWGKCANNPVLKIKFYSEKENKRVRYLENFDKIKLLNACQPPLRRIVFFALQTGMRQGEILNLKWSDVDYKTNLLKIGHSKAGKPRYVDINSELVNMLKSIPTVSEYVFGASQGKEKWSLYRKPFVKAVLQAGLSDLRFHDLRHCFASDLVMKGVDLKTVAELLGHASTQMTERYSHLSPAHKRAAVEMLPKGLLSHAGVTQVLTSSNK